MKSQPLMERVSSIDTLQVAAAWLQSDSPQYQPDLGKLANKLQSGEYCFQPLTTVATTNRLGEPETLEIWDSQDRLVLKAMSLVLKDHLRANFPTCCHHLEGRSGIKKAVRKTRDFVRDNPDSWVLKIDVTGYHAQIDHFILYNQIQALIPNEDYLLRLTWQYLQRTVYDGGNYYDRERGISLGCPLSPLMAAVYLMPLDEAFAGPSWFYARFMDDWLVVVPTRWKLNSALEKASLILNQQKLPKADNNIGRSKSGFDFLGYHFTPESVGKVSLQRRDARIYRLYEQSADNNRVEEYVSRWQRWARASLPPRLTSSEEFHNFPRQVDSSKLPLEAKFLALGVVSVLSTAAFDSHAAIYQLGSESDNRWVLAWTFSTGENAVDKEGTMDVGTLATDSYHTAGIFFATAPISNGTAGGTGTQTGTECATKVTLNGIKLGTNHTAAPENAVAESQDEKPILVAKNKTPDEEQKYAWTRIAPAKNPATNALFVVSYGKDDSIPDLDKIKVITTCTPINVINTPPIGENNTVTLGLDKENTYYSFSSGEFGFNDEDEDAFASIKITQLESTGDLKLSGVGVSLNQVIPETEISNLKFHPAAAASGTNFKFKVNDGTDDSKSDYTMTIDVTDYSELDNTTIGGTEGSNSGNITIIGGTNGSNSGNTTSDGTDNSESGDTTSDDTGNRPLPRTMRLSVEISGNGKVSSTPHGISCKTSDCEKVSFKGDATGRQCNDSCKAIFDTATWVTLTPTPAAGSEFIGWGEHKDCVDGKLFLLGNSLCVAYFRPKQSTTRRATSDTPVAVQTVRLVSSRAQIQENGVDVITGFKISGNQTVMLIGMALEEQVDPILTLRSYPDEELIATNNNWANDSRSHEIPISLQPPRATDAGLLIDLPAGDYTVTMSSETTSGLGLIVVNTVANSSPNFDNMNTCALIQGGANDVIAGFILEGTGTQKVMIRGLGLEDGVDATLTVQTYPDGVDVAKNDNWEDNAQAANIPANLKLPKATDAGLLLDLPAGAYTVILSTNGNKGLGVISIDKVN